MCHNIIDGRYHTECGHFYSMSTFQKDCGRNNCLFSSRHAPGCQASSCIQKMNAPTHNPIRISNTTCAECMIRAREGTTIGASGDHR
ncbi:hypothetical protein BYT27DRAFT_6913352 [Phlegmacium glaucopus]|nr:hypothetical protein BYT27DRAFT_6913352 [Phlegmacium glaucopus]